MFVRVRRTRAAGRKIPDHEASRPEHQFVGYLCTNGSEFRLWASGSMVWPPIMVLYDGRVLSIQASDFYVRGYEDHNGAGVLQEWVCHVLTPEDFQRLSGLPISHGM
jgi:hypothetical protein